MLIRYCCNLQLTIVFASLLNSYPRHWLTHLQSTGSWAQSKWRLAPGLGILSTSKSVFLRFYEQYCITLHQLFKEYPVGSTSCGQEESTILLFFAVFCTRAVSRHNKVTQDFWLVYAASRLNKVTRVYCTVFFWAYYSYFKKLQARHFYIVSCLLLPLRALLISQRVLFSCPFKFLDLL